MSLLLNPRSARERHSRGVQLLSEHDRGARLPASALAKNQQGLRRDVRGRAAPCPWLVSPSVAPGAGETSLRINSIDPLVRASITLVRVCIAASARPLAPAPSSIRATAA